MTAALDPVIRLRRLLPHLADLGKDGAALASGIRRYLSEAELGLSLEEALEIKPSWWIAESAEALRARLVKELAARFDGSAYQRSTTVALCARRYASDVWPRERGRAAPPTRAEEALLWRLHRNACSAARWPLSAKQIARLLEA